MFFRAKVMLLKGIEGIEWVFNKKKGFLILINFIKINSRILIRKVIVFYL